MITYLVSVRPDDATVTTRRNLCRLRGARCGTAIQNTDGCHAPRVTYPSEKDELLGGKRGEPRMLLIRRIDEVFDLPRRTKTKKTTQERKKKRKKAYVFGSVAKFVEAF